MSKYIYFFNFGISFRDFYFYQGHLNQKATLSRKTIKLQSVSNCNTLKVIEWKSFAVNVEWKKYPAGIVN
jgi:hypothetical protein